MQVKYVEMETHPVLGTFKYNFVNDKFITLLVGKNGSGKTRLIEAVFKLLDNGFRMWDDKEYKDSKMKAKMNLLFSKEECELLNITTTNLVFEVDCSDLTNKNGWLTIGVSDADNGTNLTDTLRLRLQSDENDGFLKLFKLKIRNSPVQINFEYKPVTSFADAVDDDKKIQTKATPTLIDEINKLLVSAFHRDNAHLGRNSKNGIALPDYKGDFDRFKDAYAKLFKEKEIIRVDTGNDDNKIIFKDINTNKEFGIDGLSSGEQQVVYRAGYLLKHLGIKKGGIVFIDEPELSLHPEWQTGYVPFLQNVFGDDIQFIIATHSSYIVKSGIDNDKVSISKLYTEKGNLADEKLHHTSKLGHATFAEVNYKAFNIPSEEFHTELYLALQRQYSPEKFFPDENKYIDGTPTSLDKVLKEKPNVTQMSTWTDKHSKKEFNETLMTFIRNIINHGEDAINRGRIRKYSPEELEKSIKEMLELL